MKAYLEDVHGELLEEKSMSTQFEILNELKDLSNHNDSNCLHRTRYLFEFDDRSLEEQIKLITPLLDVGLIKRVTYSGSKSFHIVVETDYDAKDTDEYKAIWKYFEQKYFPGCDKACANPARLTRCPGAYRFDKQKTQDLIYESDDIVHIDKHILRDITGQRAYNTVKRMVTKATTPPKTYTKKTNGQCLNYEPVQYFLNKSFPNVTGNGDSSISLFKALRCCIKYNDVQTQDLILNKARLEHWTETELNRMIKNIEDKYL